MNKTLCKIIVTSDIHGHVFPTDYCSDTSLNIGLAKLATQIKQEKKLHPDLLLLDNGDLIQGTPLATYALKHDAGVHPAVQVLNELGYEAAVFGNHEFNYGMDKLEGIVEESHFPWLAANIVNEKSGEPAFGTPYIVKVLESGVKVAVLGITTHYIPNWERPEHIRGLVFKDALTETKAWVERIRAEVKPDLLVVSYHGGFERDLTTGAPTERGTGENQGYAMCTEIEGIDVLITGHQHRYLAGQVGDVTVIQPGCKGQALGLVNIEFTKVDGKWKISKKHAELVKIEGDIAPDSEIISLTQEVENKTQVWLDQPIGEVLGDMSIASVMECRLRDHPFIEFVNKVQMDVTGVDVGNAALLSESSAGFQGQITLRDVLTNFPYPNTLTVLRLRGQDIKDALEQTADYFIVGEDGQPAVNPSYIEPKPAHYNYDMWEGIQYKLDITKPVGQRVTLLHYHGEELAPDQEIDVVMNSYRAGGGGDYEMYRSRPVVREIMSDMAEMISEYILARGKIEASCDGNWEVVW